MIISLSFLVLLLPLACLRLVLNTFLTPSALVKWVSALMTTNPHWGLVTPILPVWYVLLDEIIRNWRLMTQRRTHGFKNSF